MQIVISNQTFNYDIGCKLLKSKHRTCPLPELKKTWDDIQPATFKEVVSIKNMEARRIGISILGIDNIVKELSSKTVNKKTLDKQTTWVDSKGNLTTKKYKDTYELFSVSRKHIIDDNSRDEKLYYLRFKCTSTNREYLMWIDIDSVKDVIKDSDRKLTTLDAIDCIAWTIQTDIPKGEIKEIIRQGDCIMIRPKSEYTPLSQPRHLTRWEYLKLLEAES